MLSLSSTDISYREDCIRAEARAQNAEEELDYLRGELQTAHRVLDSHVTRSTEYKRCGQRLMSLAERIDAFVDKIVKTEGEGWEKYNQQFRANAVLVSDIEAIRKSLDQLEVENFRLSKRKEAA